MATNGFNRRRVLRGVLSGGAVTVGLPLLNCFLNENGNALASGEKMPVRFGTWSWALGMNKEIFVPKKTGKDFEFPEEVEALAPLRDKINIHSNANAFRDSAPNLCHFTGWVVGRTGVAPMVRGNLPSATYDTRISNRIGRSSRFKTLIVNGGADARVSLSYEDANTLNPSEYSPLLFYTRLFGPDFIDPNGADFKPNPRVMVRKSVLSGVLDDMGNFSKKIGTEDRARLDQYLTGLRQLEQQFDQQLTKPEPIAACHPASEPKESEFKLGTDSSLVAQRHKLMTDLLAMAVACDQTRVVNASYASFGAGTNTTKPGYDKPHHTTTHEEAIDAKLGYQPVVSWFARRSMEGFAYFVSAFDKIKEGDGTVLDNMLIVADSDHSLARMHSVEGMAFFTAGRAGGKVKNGFHIDMKGTSVSRAAYTALRVMDVDVEKFGEGSNRTSDVISEILA